MASRSADRPLSKQRSMEERVDVWGENQKAARKNLPKKRARVQRAYRRAVTVELQQGEDADPESIRRKQFWKWSGATRAQHLERQRDRRERQQVEPRSTDAARERRKARRGRARPSGDDSDS